MFSTLWHCTLIRGKLLIQRPLELLLLLLALPLTMILMSQLLQSSIHGEGIPIAIVDQDQSEYSQLVVERVSQQPIVEIHRVDEATATRLVQQHEIEAAFVIREGFMEQMLQGQRKQVIEILQSPASLSTGMLQELFTSEVLRLGSNVQVANFVQEQYLDKKRISSDEAVALWQEAWAHSDGYWEPEPLMSVRYKELPALAPNREAAGEVEDPAQEGGIQAQRENVILLFGWLSALIMLLVIFLQQWIVEEKQNGVLQRVKGFSSKSSLYLLGHSIPIFTLVLLDVWLTLLFIDWHFSYSLFSTLDLLVLLLFYIFVCFTLGFCLASWVKTTAQLQGAGLTIVLLTSIFGGAFVALADWTKLFQLFSQWTAQGWLLKGVRDILYYSADSSVLGLSVAVLLGFSIFFLILGIWRWRSV